MAIVIATLDGLDLPMGFRYKPFIQKKRNSITRTANSVITQSASPTQIVHGDGFLSWSIKGAYPTEFQMLIDLYDTAIPTPYIFTGYWGEVLNVYFTEFESPTVQGGLFSIDGQFQVIEVVYEYNAECIS